MGKELGKPSSTDESSVTKGKITMTGKLTARSAESLAKRKGRWLDGGGLFLRVLEPGHKAYWTYRYRVNGNDREMSVGAVPAMSLALARIRHAELKALVLKGVDPVGDRRKGKAALATPSSAPTFAQCADRYIAAHEGEWKNSKHHQQWVMTLREYAAPIRDMPVHQVDTAAIVSVLEPIWNVKPETASRLRGRIEAVLASAQVDGHIEEGRSNPARWKNWLDHKLAAPKKLGKLDRKTGEKVKRGSHPAMPFRSVPAFMARLGSTPGMASLALQLTILTACRTSEVLDMTFDEVDFDAATWVIPEQRMKMELPHRVPLSAPALAILRAQHATRGQNPHLFPGRPMRGLSNMSMAMLMRRLGMGAFTVHGFRSSFRDWATEVDKTEYATAERCLAHVVGNSAALSYDRSDRLELRRPVMTKWANYATGEAGDNVIELRRTGA